MVKHETEKFFNMSAGIYCGLLLREPAAKKLGKLLYRQSQEIKRLLMENLDDIEVSDWTLAYPNDKQTVIHYFDAESTKENKILRINLFDKASNVSFVREVFSSDLSFTESRKEIESYATEHLLIDTEAGL